MQEAISVPNCLKLNVDSVLFTNSFTFCKGNWVGFRLFPNGKDPPPFYLLQ